MRAVAFGQTALGGSCTCFTHGSLARNRYGEVRRLGPPSLAGTHKSMVRRETNQFFYSCGLVILERRGATRVNDEHKQLNWNQGYHRYSARQSPLGSKAGRQSASASGNLHHFNPPDFLLLFALTGLETSAQRHQIGKSSRPWFPQKEPLHGRSACAAPVQDWKTSASLGFCGDLVR